MGARWAAARGRGLEAEEDDRVRLGVRLVGAGVALEGHEGRSDAKATRGQV